MSILSKLARVVLFACCGAANVSALAADAAKPHWDYQGAHGPSHWGETCALGNRQSPIDIRGATPADLPALKFQYGSVAPSIVNNGHTIQVNVPAGNGVQVGDQRYELLQFHFHSPSEERIKGQQSPLVAHLVHRNAAGQLGVVAVLLQAGKSGSAFDAVLDHLPAHAGETLTVADLSLDLAALLPKDLGYYAFEGSLTTPPCSEGVNWMVLKKPVTVSAARIKAFKSLYQANARPVQPLNGREVKVSK